MRRILKLIPFYLFCVLAFPGILIAQDASPVPDVNLEQCVSYFVQGDIWTWIGGGLVVITGILGVFSKQSWIGLIKEIGNFLRNRSKK